MLGKYIEGLIGKFTEYWKRSVAFRAMVIAIVASCFMLGIAQCARAAALSDYLENKAVDHVFRGTAYTAPATTYVALYTSACTDAAGGTEVSGGSYARVAVTSGLTQWAGTQGAGTTTASSGTSGTISNNAAITYPAPTANWGSITHWGILDAAAAGNLLICAALTTAKTVNNGDAAPSFAAGALTIQIDN